MDIRYGPTDYLAHYGVVGMKWGIRRYQPYSVKPRSSGKAGKEVGEAKHKIIKNPERAKKIAKGAAIAGGTVAGTLILRAAIKSPKVQAAVVIGKFAWNAMKLRVGASKIPKISASAIAAGKVAYDKFGKSAKELNKVNATLDAYDKVKKHTSKKADGADTSSKRIANEALKKYEGKSMNDIDKNELRQTMEVVNSITRLEQVSSGNTGEGKKKK